MFLRQNIVEVLIRAGKALYKMALKKRHHKIFLNEKT